MAILSVIAGLIILYAAYREIKMRAREREKNAKGFSTKPKGGLVENLTDPREAAAILLVQIAVEGDGVSLQEKECITTQMKTSFGSDEEEAEGLFSFGRMAVGQLGDVSTSLKRLLKPIHSHCTLQEMKDLILMMEEVALVSGSIAQPQKKLISMTKSALHLDGYADQME